MEEIGCLHAERTGSKTGLRQPPQVLECHVRYCADGLVLAHSETDLPANALDPKRVEAAGLEGLLAQFDTKDTSAQGAATLIPSG